MNIIIRLVSIIMFIGLLCNIPAVIIFLSKHEATPINYMNALGLLMIYPVWKHLITK